MFHDINSFINLLDFPLAIWEENNFNIIHYNISFKDSIYNGSNDIRKVFSKIEFENLISNSIYKFDYNCKFKKRNNIPFEFFLHKIDDKNYLIYGMNILRVKEQEFMMKSFGKIQKENEFLKEKMEKDALEMATTIQKSLLPIPTIVTENFSITSFYQAAVSVGGDWFNYFLDGNTAHIYIGDITGHGFAPALLTAVISGVFEKHCMLAINLKKNFSCPIAILNDFNEVLIKLSKQNFMMTMLAMVISNEKMDIYSYSAAHNFPFLIKKSQWDGNSPLVVESIVNTGNRLGHSKEVFFKEKHTQTQIGDIIFAYTDGIVEGISNKEEFGVKKLKKLLMKHYSVKGISHAEIMENIKTEILTSFDSSILEDDISAISIEILS